MSQTYQEGNYFSVPLGRGSWALGLIARKPVRGAVLLGYFFGPRRRRSDTTPDAQEQRPEDAVLACRFKDSGLHRGLWRVIALDRQWRRENWPMPAFLRKEGLSGTGIRIEYNDENLLIPAVETPAEITDAHLGEDVVLDEERVVDLLEKALQDYKSGGLDPAQWTG